MVVYDQDWVQKAFQRQQGRAGPAYAGLRLPSPHPRLPRDAELSLPRTSAVGSEQQTVVLLISPSVSLNQTASSEKRRGGVCRSPLCLADRS